MRNESRGSMAGRLQALCGGVALAVLMCLGVSCSPLPAGEILFVRHGETVANQTGNYSDATVNQLTRKGVAQADALVGVLKRESIDVVVTSPAPRCLRTITPYLRSRNKRAAIWPELEEVSNRTLAKSAGKPEMRMGREIEVPAELARHFGFERADKRQHIELRGKEDALAQIKHAADRLRAAAKRRGTTILVVGHSIHGSRLLEELTGQPMVGKIPIENGALTRLVVDPQGRARIVMLNGKPVAPGR